MRFTAVTESSPAATRRRAVCPRISTAVQPKIASAAGFHEVMKPAASRTMIASAVPSMTRVRKSRVVSSASLRAWITLSYPSLYWTARKAMMEAIARPIRIVRSVS